MPWLADAVRGVLRGGVALDLTNRQLEIMLPDIDEQKHIVSNLSNKLGKIENLTNENEKQREYIKKLRQSILQDAIEGKLTAEWRKDHPVIKGNPDFDAESLFEKIQQEKQKAQAGKKQKQLPPIADNEKAFEIPDSWKWVRLGEICKKITDGTHNSPINQSSGDFLYITAKNITSGGVDLSNVTYVSQLVHKDIYSRCNVEYGDILYIKDGATTGIVCLNQIREQFSLLSSVALLKTYFKDNKFLKKFLESTFFYQQTRSQMYGVAITRVTIEKIINATILLPPLAEQEEIVRIIDEKFAKLDLIEQEIKQRENYINSLKRSIMEEVFEGE